MANRVHSLNDDEFTFVEHLAASRTTPARQVERAQTVWQPYPGSSVTAIADHLCLNPQTVHDWLKRFNAQGLPDLEDCPSSGKPPTYTPQEAGEIIAAALSNPQELDLPFAYWTLNQLVAYLNENKSLTIKRSRISELLIQKDLR